MLSSWCVISQQCQNNFLMLTLDLLSATTNASKESRSHEGRQMAGLTGCHIADNRCD